MGTKRSKEREAQQDLHEMKEYATSLRQGLKAGKSHTVAPADQRFLPYMVREMNVRKNMNVHCCQNVSEAVDMARSLASKQPNPSQEPYRVRFALGDNLKRHTAALDVRVHPNGRLTMILMDSISTQSPFEAIPKNQNRHVAGTLSFSSFAQKSYTDCHVFAMHNLSLLKEDEAKFDGVHMDLLAKSRGQEPEGFSGRFEKAKKDGPSGHHYAVRDQGPDGAPAGGLLPLKALKHVQSENLRENYFAQFDMDPRDTALNRRNENEKDRMARIRSEMEVPEKAKKSRPGLMDMFSAGSTSQATDQSGEKKKQESEFNNALSINQKRVVYLERAIADMDSRQAAGEPVAMPSKSVSERLSGLFRT